jgi:hypothetical protein
MGESEKIPDAPLDIRDPFWAVIIGAANAEMDACELALVAQGKKDDEWYRRTRESLEAKGCTDDALRDALNLAIRDYFKQPRARCTCGAHQEGGLR